MTIDIGAIAAPLVSTAGAIVVTKAATGIVSKTASRGYKGRASKSSGVGLSSVGKGYKKSGSVFKGW